MPRTFVITLLGFVLLAASLAAQEPIQRGKIKKIDVEKQTVILTVDGQDRVFLVTEETRVFGSNAKEVRERLKGLKEGAAVQFKAGKKDGKDVLVGIRSAGGQPPPVGENALRPLTELGDKKYQDFAGGLYPDGKNERPAAHEAAGLALAKQVRPLDAQGKPAADGKIVFLSVGMSNTTQEFSTFKQLADADKEKNPRLVIVDGAQGGMTAARIQDAEDNGAGLKFWTTVDQRLKAAEVSRKQVQVAWIKQANAGPTEGFPQYAQKLQSELARIVQLMQKRFPNLKMVYLSSRTYGGYAKTGLNPEPYAYQSAFAVRWLIEQQLKGEAALNHDPGKGEVKAPWLSWGPYLWANGTVKRADGFFYEEGDFAGDGTHPSASGRRKVAELLLKFCKTDPTARPWFLSR